MDTDKIYAEHIVNEYSKKETTKVNQLRKLDARAKRPAAIFTYTFGTIGALILGIGMCLSMKVIGNGSRLMFIIGIIIGLVGIAMVTVNPLFYNKILENSKKKYAADIIALAKQISGEE